MKINGLLSKSGTKAREEARRKERRRTFITAPARPTFKRWERERRGREKRMRKARSREVRRQQEGGEGVGGEEGGKGRQRVVPSSSKCVSTPDGPGTEQTSLALRKVVQRLIRLLFPPTSFWMERRRRREYVKFSSLPFLHRSLVTEPCTLAVTTQLQTQLLLGVFVPCRLGPRGRTPSCPTVRPPPPSP